MAKVFTYRGKTVEELRKLSLKEFAELLPARQRRSITRGLTEMQKKFLQKIKKESARGYKKIIKTHCRNIVILPEMIGIKMHIYNGKDFVPLQITEEMIGRYLGEFSLTRRPVKHSAPGVGATKSSAALSVK